MNIADETVAGSQWSGSVNYAKHVTGPQIAYDINIAGKADKFQLSCMNIADTVLGSQIGLINVSKKLGGSSFGMLTVTENGIFHLDASTEESGMQVLQFASGKNVFTSLSFGYAVYQDAHPYSFGLGFGYAKYFRRGYLEGEVQWHLVMDKDTKDKDIEDDGKHVGDSDWRHNTLLQAKLRSGWTLYRNLGIFAGISFNTLVTHDNGRLIGPWTEDWTTHEEDEFHWPGAEIGIRIGR